MLGVEFYKYKIIPLLMIIIIATPIIATSISGDKYNNEYANVILADIENDSKVAIEKLAKDLNNKRYNSEFDRGAINSLLGYAYLKQGDFKKSEVYLQEGIRIFENTQNINEYINIYMLLVGNLHARGDYKSSLIASNGIITMLDKNIMINDDTRMKASVLTLSILISTFEYFDLDNEVDNYINQLERITDGNENYENELSLKVKINYYISKKKYKLAQKNIYKYENLAKFNNKELKVDVNLYKTIIDIQKGNYKKAYNSLDTVKQYYKSKDNDLMGMYLNIVEGDYYKGIKDYDKALNYYDKAYNEFTDEGIIFLSNKSLEKIIKMNIDNKNEKNIISYISSYKLNEEKLKVEKEGLIGDLLKINGKFMDYELEQIKKENEIIKVRNSYITKIFNIVAIISVILAIVIVVLIKEVNNRKKSENKLKEVINKDYLTKSYTRAYAFSHIEEFIVKERKFSMALIDLDDFKKINDKYGHVVGDEVLKRISSIGLKHMGCEDIFCRFGGEEFLIVFAGFTSDAMYCVCEDIRKEIEALDWEYEGLITTISIGIKEYEGEDIDKFTELVDNLLYKAKLKGKNQTCI